MLSQLYSTFLFKEKATRSQQKERGNVKGVKTVLLSRRPCFSLVHDDIWGRLGHARSDFPKPSAVERRLAGRLD